MGVVYRGKDLTVADENELTSYRRHHVGFVFQFYNLIPSLTALENIAVVTEIAKSPMQPEEALIYLSNPDGTYYRAAQRTAGDVDAEHLGALLLQLERDAANQLHLGSSAAEWPDRADLLERDVVLDAVDVAAPLDLDGHGGSVDAATEQIDRSHRRRILSPDEGQPFLQQKILH